MQEKRAWNRLKDEELIEILKSMNTSELYPANAQKVYEALKDKYDANDLPSVRTVDRRLRSLLGKSGKELNEIIYVFLTIFLYLLKCPQSLIL